MANESEGWLDPIFDAVFSEIQQSGYFDKVNDWEPKGRPGRGITAGLWVDTMDPLSAASGLSATACNITFILRAYKNIANQLKPGVPALQDAIDRHMLKAMSNMARRFHGDFDFQDTIRNVDLLGYFGRALSIKAGYLEQDKVWYRTMDLIIPCIVNDVWPQVNQP
jgi:hypothetical protein